MGSQINEITIVGGGTAGWLTAAFLVRYLNFNKEEKPTKITLIESPNVPTIGLVRQLFQVCQICFEV
nr:tryptophan 7-halogenase [Sneathiella glossodoripedis]